MNGAGAISRRAGLNSSRIGLPVLRSISLCTCRRHNAPADFAFRQVNNVGTRIDNGFAAQWLAYTLPYRRFADVLADPCARIGATWMSGRGASYPTPPPQIPSCSFPAVGSRRRSNAIEGKELGSRFTSNP